MCHAADDLAFDDHWIDQAAGVVDHDVAQDADTAGFDIDLDFDGMAAKPVGERWRNEVLQALQTRLEIAGHELCKHLAALKPVAVLREHGRVPDRIVGR